MPNSDDNQDGLKSITVEIGDPRGLHLRVAGELVKVCMQFHSKVAASKVGSARKVDCHSPLSLLTLSATAGTKLLFTANGDDAEDVLAAIAKLFAPE